MNHNTANSCRTQKVLSAILAVLLLLAPFASQDFAADDPTVYITKTGEKYHRDDCRYLKKSKIAVKLSEAKKAGYSACSVCRPPN